MNKPPWLKTIWILTALCVVGIISVTALAYAYVGKDTSDKNTAAVRGSCQFWRDLASIELTPSSSKVAFQIVADARIAYDRQGCVSVNGVLPPPDSRVVPFLPKGHS